MGKIYKSANGTEIDMGQLILKHERVRAVGNMNVNARGDVLDANNKIIAERSTQVNKGYRKQTGNVQKDIPVSTSSKKAADDSNRLAAQNSATEEADEILKELDTLSVTEVKAEPAKAKSKTKAKKASGLASAIEKSKNK